MRFCMRSYVHCPECYSGILVSLSISPQLYWGTCLPPPFQFSAGSPITLALWGALALIRRANFSHLVQSSAYMPSYSRLLNYRHIALSNLRNLKVYFKFARFFAPFLCLFIVPNSIRVSPAYHPLPIAHHLSPLNSSSLASVH